MNIPELTTASSSVRLPPLRNATFTPRIARLVDHPLFQRLRTVRQLGPTHLVYPGAVHTRFEHSLGVFDLTLRYIQALLPQEEARALLEPSDVVEIMLAALLHDLGHYPFAHSLEAVHLPGRDAPRHETLAGTLIRGDIELFDDHGPTLATLIADEFDVEPERVIALIEQKPSSHARAPTRLVASILSSGIDADKADYLERDSLHMGVPYGRNYDRGRFLQSLCVHPEGDRIAVTTKGRVSTEIFVFGRYTMFSEAYWHHTVRAVSAMVEQALFDFRAHSALSVEALTELLLTSSDDALLDLLVAQSPPDRECSRILREITRHRRRPYKRLLTLSRAYDDLRAQDAYERIYHLDAAGRVELRRRLRDVLSGWIGHRLEPHELLIDIPPRDKDHIDVPDVVHRADGARRAMSLAHTSKVVQGIANDFVKVVKRIRVFVHPRVHASVETPRGGETLRERLVGAILEFAPETDFQQRIL